MRPQHDIYFQNNIYSKEADNIYKITNSSSDWLSTMISYINADKKIVLPTNSLLEAKTYYKIITDSFPNKKVQLYSSEMPQSEKNEHFSNIHHYWSELDVLIYTPTCSAGISFELEHYDYVFAHMTDASCDVETCRQMLMRVRNIRSNTYYIYFPPYSSNIGNYPITIEDIYSSLKNKKIEMLNGYQNLHFEYNANGDIKYFETNYFHLWMENIRIENLSKNNFVGRFIQYTVQCGANISVMEKNNAIKISYSNAKKDIKYMIAESISNANNLTSEEMRELISQRQSQQGETVSEAQALQRYFLCDFYRIKYEDRIHSRITPEFVLQYNNEGVKKVFKYLSKICEYSTVEESLLAIQHKDIEAYSVIGIENIANYKEGIEYFNLVKYKYTYTNHLAIQKIIVFCGFAFINVFMTQPIYLSEDAIYSNIIENISNIEKYMLLISSEIKMSKAFLDIPSMIKRLRNEKNKAEFLKKIIKFINFGLSQFYGIEIKKNKLEWGLILGKIASMFQFVKDDGNFALIPQIVCNLLQE